MTDVSRYSSRHRFENPLGPVMCKKMTLLEKTMKNALHLIKQYLFLILLLLLLIGCSSKTERPASVPVQKPVFRPDWFILQDLRTQPYEYMGYGEGATAAEAQASARSEIVKNIQVMVTSTIKQSTEVERRTGAAADIKTSALIEISEQSRIELDDVRTVRYELLDDRHYVALKYINLPIDQKIAVTLEEATDDPCSASNRSSYLSHTELMKDLKREIGCEPEIRLIRQNKIWYVNTSRLLFRLPLAELGKLWAGIQEDGFSIAASNPQLRRGDFFHLTVNSAENGFLSLFDVYHTGQTVLLAANVPLTADKPYVYPDLTEYHGLEAMVPAGHETTQDLFVALLCPINRDFSRFELIDEKDLASENSYRFGDLINAMNDCRIATTTVQIR
jgi:hypothetical protein